MTLDPDEADALAENVGASDSDPAALAEHDGVRAELQAAVDEANKRSARIEPVKRFAILEPDLMQEHEELTPEGQAQRRLRALRERVRRAS